MLAGRLPDLPATYEGRQVSQDGAGGRGGQAKPRAAGPTRSRGWDVLWGDGHVRGRCFRCRAYSGPGLAGFDGEELLGVVDVGPLGLHPGCIDRGSLDAYLVQATAEWVEGVAEDQVLVAIDRAKA